jgi:hypothetical protein
VNPGNSSNGSSDQLLPVPRDAKTDEHLRKLQGNKSEHFGKPMAMYIVNCHLLVLSKCLLETTTCWISAEHHARSKISAVSQVFKMFDIEESEYIILAGFDESLIESGVGYLEQVHILQK